MCGQTRCLIREFFCKIGKQLVDLVFVPRLALDGSGDTFDQLVAMIGNRVLALVMNAIRQVYLLHPELFVNINQPGRFDPSHHRRLVAALEAGDATAAGCAMTEYAESAESLLGLDE